MLVLSEAKNGFTDENKFHSQILRHSTFHQSCSAEPVDSSLICINLGNIFTTYTFLFTQKIEINLSFEIIYFTFHGIFYQILVWLNVKLLVYNRK